MINIDFNDNTFSPIPSDNNMSTDHKINSLINKIFRELNRSWLAYELSNDISSFFENVKMLESLAVNMTIVKGTLPPNKIYFKIDNKYVGDIEYDKNVNELMIIRRYLHVDGKYNIPQKIRPIHCINSIEFRMVMLNLAKYENEELIQALERIILCLI